ncbi:MAG: tyrosine-type recombinase/integrase [Pirellulales bacterium]
MASPSLTATDSVAAQCLLEALKHAYLVDRKLRLKPNTWDLYKERLDFTLADLGIETIDQLTLHAVDAYVQRRLDAGATARTANLQVTILRRMLRWGVSREWDGLPRDPLRNWQPLKETPRKRRALTPEEIARLLETAPVHRRLLWATMIATGIRRSEAIGMQIDDFDAERSLIVVRPEHAKSGRQRVIPIPRGLTDILATWLETDLRARRQVLDDYLASTRRVLQEVDNADETKAENLRHLEDKLRRHRGHQHLFRNGRGLPYLKSNLLRDFRVDLQRAKINLTGVDLHALRVANATHLRAAAVPDAAVKQRLGHCSISTTDRHYTDFRIVDGGQGVDVIAALIGVTNDRVKGHDTFAATMPNSGLSLAAPELLRPTPEVLASMVSRYSNILIGRICGTSEAAVRKWLRAAGIVRMVHKVSGAIPEVELALLRADLRRAMSHESTNGSPQNGRSAARA